MTIDTSRPWSGIIEDLLRVFPNAERSALLPINWDIGLLTRYIAASNDLTRLEAIELIELRLPEIAAQNLGGGDTRLSA